MVYVGKQKQNIVCNNRFSIPLLYELYKRCITYSGGTGFQHVLSIALGFGLFVPSLFLRK